VNKQQRYYLFTVILLLVTIYTVWPKKEKTHLSVFTGQTMGTITYTVKVVGNKPVGLQQGIDSLLVAFNASLSTYIPTSEISEFNKTNSTSPTRLLKEVYLASKEMYEKTNGAFDPTVGPLINRWGFGPDKKINAPDSTTIDSLLLLVGFEKVAFQNDLLTKDPGVYLDFSAIAKGQGVDEVGKWLERKGITNYMVEIGGEVRCRGKNEKGEVWSIGIEDPTVAQFEQRLFAIAKMTDRSLATSGNYRNYYKQDGQVIAHIVDPRTGFTAKHNLLSASVFAPDCMTADAYATAFMVLGLEESIALAESTPGLDAVFIFSTPDQLDVYVTTGMSEAITFVEEL
jgi:thiamine biosynthesis lipoprotein